MLISIFLAIKMATKFIGILPLTVYHEFDKREGMYTTLLMSTGLTFGSISALFGLTNRIIDQAQYTILVTAVIGSAVVPTLIAQRWFQPELKTLEAWTIEPQYKSVPGVADDSGFGGGTMQYQVLLDPVKVAGAGLSVQQVQASLSANNSNSGESISARIKLTR